MSLQTNLPGQHVLWRKKPCVIRAAFLNQDNHLVLVIEDGITNDLIEVGFREVSTIGVHKYLALKESILEAEELVNQK